MKRLHVMILGGLLVFLTPGGDLWAQATAQVSGTVSDVTGARLPGVEVTTTQIDTGISRTTVSNETGAYTFPGLAIGPRRLEASLPGFRTFVRTGIVLQVNDRVVIPVVLEVGQVAETIEVTANAALVETRASSVGQLIDNERILELPLNGRNVQDLITLTGAAVQTGESGERFFAGTPYVSVGGAPQGFGVDFSMDGAPHLNFATGIGMPMPFPDATQEFKVESSGLSAERGRATSVGSVTKSGTNQIHGNGFWFVRNDLFNAQEYFRRSESTLKRNQYGGTIGGPIVQNKLFFFFGYQGTTVRSDTESDTAFIPTAAALSGDFSGMASAACNRGNAVQLRDANGVPFLNNQIDPALFSPAALELATRLVAGAGTPIDACGEVAFGVRLEENLGQWVGKVDYQASPSHSLFGRVFLSRVEDVNPFDTDPGNLLLSPERGNEALAQSHSIGSTYLIGANIVNSFRFAYNRAGNTRIGSVMGFSYCDVGVNMYCGYDPEHIGRLRVSGGPGFEIGETTGSGDNANIYNPEAYQFNNDVSVVQGNHQFTIGGALTYGKFRSDNHFASAGQIDFTGGVTGLGMADFFLGRIDDFFIGAPAAHSVTQKLFSIYGADTWQVAPTLTFNYGVRWEPYLPQTVTEGNVYTFEIERFRQGLHSTVFPGAPAGLIYPGDADYRNPKTGIDNQWGNFAPRFGMAWDITGDGRTSLRSSYAYSYAFVSGDWRDTYNGHPPFGGRLTLFGPEGGLDDPWLNQPGGNPFPLLLDQNVVYPNGGIFTSVPQDLQTPSTSSWNLTLQREVASDWMVSGSYIGSLTTHLWAARPINPAVYFPGVADANGNCFAQGYTFNRGTPGATCSSNRGSSNNTQERRRFSLERPADGALMSHVMQMDPGGTQNYHGMLLSVQRRATEGLTVNANYTLSHCIGPYATMIAMGPHVDDTYSNPDDRDFDRGNCDSDRRHVVNMTAVAETPEFANPTLRAIGTGWQLSGIYRWSSGSPLEMFSGRDQAFSGVIRRGATPQRPDVILASGYGDRDAGPFSNYLNRAAFDFPAAGTLGNLGRGIIVGPAHWSFDLALTRAFQLTEVQRVEVRAEAYNVLNSFRPEDPNALLRSNTFGQIRDAQDPRILQFALKYVF